MIPKIIEIKLPIINVIIIPLSETLLTDFSSFLIFFKFSFLSFSSWINFKNLQIIKVNIVIPIEIWKLIFEVNKKPKIPNRN